MSDEAGERHTAARDQAVLGLGLLVMLLTVVSVVASGGVVAVHLTGIAAAVLTGRAWSRTASRKTSARRS